MLSKTWSVTKKETLHIWRAPGTFFLVVVSPLFLLMLMTYALAADVKNVPIAVLDQDRTTTSREYIDQITNGPDLTLAHYASSLQEIDKMLVHNEIRAGVIIAPGFEEEVTTLSSFPVQVIIDGTEPSSGGFAFRHILGHTNYYIEERLAEGLAALGMSPSLMEAPIDLRVRTWYNPGLSAVRDVFPALIAVVLSMPAVSVSLAISREKEHGTLEQLFASPLGKSELLLGKVMPYIIAGVADVLLATAMGWIWFGVPFQGSLPLLVIFAADFFLASLAMGLVISIYVNSQQAAMVLALLIFLFPGFFLSGIFFPLAAMPPPARLEAYALPTTHYVTLMRSLFLKGTGLDYLWPNALALLVMGILFLAFGLLRFRKKLA
jgi:ABC-2 type transport system permease protein